MMPSIFLSTPRATGDHIICNGLYRYFSKNYEVCVFPVKKTLFLNVSSMLSDINNIEYIVFPDKITRRATHVAANLFEKLNFSVAKMGWDGENFPAKSLLRWDENFYHQFSLDFNMRWDNFYAPRNSEREDELFILLGCDNGKYAFLHEDETRRYIIDRKYISPQLKIIRSDDTLKKFSIFDYRKVIENASEIHCMEGSFSALVESMKLTNVPLFAHRYVRPEVLRNPWHAFTYRLNWEII
jgi:hypothetical protein